MPPVDVAVDQQVLALHRAVLGPLLGPDVAQRLLNNELKAADPAQALRLAELYATLHAAIFSELATGQDIPLIRRNLQRDYVSRVSVVLLRPATTMPADARALLRADAVQLRGELAAASRRPPCIAGNARPRGGVTRRARRCAQGRVGPAGKLADVRPPITTFGDARAA